jgi:hypothetical protein
VDVTFPVPHFDLLSLPSEPVDPVRTARTHLSSRVARIRSRIFGGDRAEPRIVRLFRAKNFSDCVRGCCAPGFTGAQRATYVTFDGKNTIRVRCFARQIVDPSGVTRTRKHNRDFVTAQTPVSARTPNATGSAVVFLVDRALPKTGSGDACVAPRRSRNCSTVDIRRYASERDAGVATTNGQARTPKSTTPPAKPIAFHPRRPPAHVVHRDRIRYILVRGVRGTNGDRFLIALFGSSAAQA